MSIPDDDHDDIAMSRTGMVGPMGTLIDDLKTKVDPDTGAAFRKLCAEADMDHSSAIRDWVYLKVHGKTYTEMLVDAAKTKRERLFGKGPIEALTIRGTVS